jgi:hypothetical protein
MNINKNSSLLRWLVLIVVIIHILYSNLYDLLVPGNTIASVTEKYKSLYAPAFYTHSIWIVIYAGLIVYSIYQLLPAQREKKIYNEIALPLMISITLHIWWGITFHLEFLGMSMIALVLALVSAFIAYRIAYYGVLDEELNKFVKIPLSIYTAWLIAAAVSRMTTWFVYIQTSGSVLGEINMTRVLILGITAAGIFLSYRYWDYIFTLILAWSVFGIYIARKDDDSTIASAAFFCGAVLLLWTILVITIKKNPRTDVQIR